MLPINLLQSVVYLRTKDLVGIAYKDSDNRYDRLDIDGVSAALYPKDRTIRFPEFY